MEAKLRREMRADQRAERTQAAEAQAARRERRKAELKAHVSRTVFTEYEPADDDDDDVLERLDAVPAAEAEIEGFLTTWRASPPACAQRSATSRPPPPAASPPPCANPAARSGAAFLPDHPFRSSG